MGMSIGWVIFIIVLVLGIVLSNILLLKQSANMEVPDSVKQAIKEKNEREARELLEKEEQKKTD